MAFCNKARVEAVVFCSTAAVMIVIIITGRGMRGEDPDVARVDGDGVGTCGTAVRAGGFEIGMQREMAVLEVGGVAAEEVVGRGGKGFDFADFADFFDGPGVVGGGGAGW